MRLLHGCFCMPAVIIESLIDTINLCTKYFHVLSLGLRTVEIGDQFFAGILSIHGQPAEI